MDPDPEIIFHGIPVKRSMILKAMAAFDADYPDSITYEEWGRYDYAVEYKGRFYPPKHIIRRAVAPETPSFSGGVKDANRAFEKLGFTVVDKPF